MFKKIYLEITNNCNLNCDFCIKNERKKKFISINEFKIVLDKIKNHTKYLYFHILGEPLLHPKINEIIDIASKNFMINITTNGYLINKVKNNKNIRQLNISLHSYDEKYGIELDKYLKNIFDVIDILKETTYISLRIWTENNNNQKIIEYMNKKYNLTIDSNMSLEKNVFISMNKKFIWPNLNNNFIEETGTCLGTIEHIGILVDGTVIPCCLDSKGDINLGNIYEEQLEDIIKKDRFIKIKEGFLKNKKVETLCQKCKFL